jgi:uncharacterized protein (DUF1800 family)
MWSIRVLWGKVHRGTAGALALAAVLSGCAAPAPPRHAPLQSLPRSTAPLALPASASQLDANPRDLALLDRLTWGGNTRAAQAIAAQGPEAFLEGQLHPPADDGLPQPVASEIDALSISHMTQADIGRLLTDRREANAGAKTPDEKLAARKQFQGVLQGLARDAQTRDLLRDLYSQNQLKEQLTWFWFNHFNVSINKANVRAFIGDYVDSAIRPHVFGRFRDLLAATAYHPAMLRYLDNAQNAAGHINENYAREIMELHTLGVNGGYTQKDVQELACILTGLGINETPDMPNVAPRLRNQYIRRGLFEFNPNRHDYGDKLFLGRVIKGSGIGEVEEALDIISANPATAHFISKKLAIYFVADDPPQSLIDHMADTFQNTGGDLTAVLETLFHSPEFEASLGKKFKDPIHYVVSAVRATYGDYVVTNANPMLMWLARLSEPLYGHETPDGYALTEPPWAGSGDMTTRFEIARAIGANGGALFADPGGPGKPVSAPITTQRYYQVVAPNLGAPTKAALAQAATPQEANLIFLSSPEFMHR